MNNQKAGKWDTSFIGKHLFKYRLSKMLTHHMDHKNLHLRETMQTFIIGHRCSQELPGAFSRPLVIYSRKNRFTPSDLPIRNNEEWSVWNQIWFRWISLWIVATFRRFWFSHQILRVCNAELPISVVILDFSSRTKFIWIPASLSKSELDLIPRIRNLKNHYELINFDL